MISSIAHPTDFSPEGQAAFEHALRLALANRCRLDVLHVHSPADEDHWRRFPRVREVLQRWGYLEEGAQVDDILAVTGVKVSKVEIRDDEPGDGLSRFLQRRSPDLVVMASHGRAGINRWLKGSVSAEVVRETLVPTLILGPSARPVVASSTGALDIKTVLVPVDHDPTPNGAIRQLEALLSALDVEFDFVHVGERAPAVRDAQGAELPVRTINGPVVETLVDEAQRASLIAMPTAGRHGVLDAVRGSTTERIVSTVGCPVLALPTISRSQTSTIVAVP